MTKKSTVEVDQKQTTNSKHVKRHEYISHHFKANSIDMQEPTKTSTLNNNTLNKQSSSESEYNEYNVRNSKTNLLKPKHLPSSTSESATSTDDSIMTTNQLNTNSNINNNQLN